MGMTTLGSITGGSATNNSMIFVGNISGNRANACVALGYASDSSIISVQNLSGPISGSYALGVSLSGENHHVNSDLKCSNWKK